MTIARIGTIPLCAGCREERRGAYVGAALHDGRCACYVIAPKRPRYGEVHVHPPDEPRPWVTGARGGRYDAVPPANDSPPRLKLVRPQGA